MMSFTFLVTIEFYATNLFGEVLETKIPKIEREMSFFTITLSPLIFKPVTYLPFTQVHLLNR